jgi:hypothetical protein
MNPVTQLLNQIIIGNRLVPKVADEACVSDSTVYASCDGRNNPNLEVVKATFVVTGDPRLRRLLEPRGWRLVPDEAQARPQRDAEGELTDVVLAASEAIQQVREAVAPHSPAGRRLSLEEAILIDRSLAEVERQLAEARAAVEALKNGSLTGLRNRKP